MFCNHTVNSENYHTQISECVNNSYNKGVAPQTETDEKPKMYANSEWLHVTYGNTFERAAFGNKKMIPEKIIKASNKCCHGYFYKGSNETNNQN